MYLLLIKITPIAAKAASPPDTLNRRYLSSPVFGTDGKILSLLISKTEGLKHTPSSSSHISYHLLLLRKSLPLRISVISQLYVIYCIICLITFRSHLSPSMYIFQDKALLIWPSRFDLWSKYLLHLLIFEEKYRHMP